MQAGLQPPALLTCHPQCSRTLEKTLTWTFMSTLSHQVPPCWCRVEGVRLPFQLLVLLQLPGLLVLQRCPLRSLLLLSVRPYLSSWLYQHSS